MVLKIVCFAGSLCLLLFGMKLMSEGIQRNAGQKLQSALAFMTGNRFVGLLTGCILTMIIQSSGATTVMLVSFVNAGLLTLEQSVGVIFGANIGTTVTAWIVALFGFNFKIEAFAIPIFGLGYVFTIVKRLKNYQGVGQALMGFALLFIALGLLKDAFQISPEHLDYFVKIQSLGTVSLFFAVIAGIIFTALIHSSSAMTAIVLTMASNHAVSWEFGAAMVIGSEIGSTIDSIMAAAGTKANAKRTALIHVMFNVATVVVALIFFEPFLDFIDFIVPGTIESNIIYHIAALHTCFKLLGTILFIPFTRQIAALTRKIIKDDKEEETSVYHLEFSEKTARETPETIVFNAQKEIADFTDVVVEMFDALQIGIKSIDERFIKEEFVTIERLEGYTNQMYEQLTHYLVRCSTLSISSQSQENVNLMIQISEELESMANGCLSIANQLKKAVEKEMPFRAEDLDRLLPYFELSRQLLQFIYKNVSKIERLSKDQFEFASELENQIDEERRNLKKIARKRLESGADVKAELLYLDIVRQIEKLGDRCFDLADDLEKR
ncbi:MAG: Na/Pi cotransporter family protein [Treponema sp.]|nr:Na/Pi cotransporter family protein [Treponema sp.]